MPESITEVLCEVRGRVGCITLQRPRALNALSLPMVRALLAQLLRWREDPQILAVAVRGSDHHGPFGHFCAGGDIRFLHRAGSSGDPQLEDFFTEEYTLNHLIFNYPKPYIAFMDGVVMGGGMGISQGASVRIVTERTQMAMPETAIGLFPDVGGSYFLSRCPGAVGEWLGLTGERLGAADAIAFGLADAYVPSHAQAALWEDLGASTWSDSGQVHAFIHSCTAPQVPDVTARATALIDQIFALPSVPAIVAALQAVGEGEGAAHAWAASTLAALQRHSPLMLHVVLAQIRRARCLDVAETLRMERGMVRHCFDRWSEARGGHSEVLEGIRALAVDKDHAPRWQPAHIDAVTDAQWQAFFVSPWPAHSHPLAGLRDHGRWVA